MESSVVNYVRDKYPKTFKDKQVLITETNTCYFIKSSIDQSPLILSKNI